MVQIVNVVFVTVTGWMSKLTHSTLYPNRVDYYRIDS